MIISHAGCLVGQELEILRALRRRFLANESGGAYWRSERDLQLYDRTFAQRIGWKWDAVLAELKLRGWRPASRRVLDWACGSGIAARTLLNAVPEHPTHLYLHDSSQVAVDFAKSSIQQSFPGIPVELSGTRADFADSLVLISHVFNELPEQNLRALLEDLQTAREIIWVESGTRENSRRFVAAVREPLLATGCFEVLGPCTHAERCGMLAVQNERHWCHSFASAPNQIFQDPFWAHFAREMGIDLRSIPFAFLALRRTFASAAGEYQTPIFPVARVIGRSRDYKGYSKVLSCEPVGVSERMLQKRDAPRLLKAVQHGRMPPLFHWQLEDGKIVGETDPASANATG